MLEKTETVKVACEGLCTLAAELPKSEWDKIPKNDDGKARCPQCNCETIVASDGMYKQNLIMDDMSGDIL